MHLLLCLIHLDLNDEIDGWVDVELVLHEVTLA